MTLFKGLSAFPITPARPDGEIIIPDLQRLVARATAAKVDSIGLLGSTGSYVYLSREQRRQAVASAVEAAGLTPVMAGIGALRTDEAQKLAEDAERSGAAGLLLAPVSYFPLTEPEVFEHFRAVSSVTELPVCIYSNPSTTQFTFTPEFVGRLAELATVAAIKLPLPTSGHVADDLSAFRSAAPGISIGYSGDWGCAAALTAGADCWYSVLAGLLPDVAVDLAVAASSGDQQRTDAINGRLEDLWVLFRTYGSLRVNYAALNILGLTDAQPPRPLLGMPKEVRSRIESVIGGLTDSWPSACSR
ncbi:MAG: dihydrodipicolinate synthase family protein [Brevundimonas sp.]|nr:MAG: dihydrodipicolinate synthase family protein [Brevundimonas sp.]